MHSYAIDRALLNGQMQKSQVSIIMVCRYGLGCFFNVIIWDFFSSFFYAKIKIMLRFLTLISLKSVGKHLS